jgi:hypothetical protein
LIVISIIGNSHIGAYYKLSTRTYCRFYVVFGLFKIGIVAPED